MRVEHQPGRYRDGCELQPPFWGELRKGAKMQKYEDKTNKQAR